MITPWLHECVVLTSQHSNAIHIVLIVLARCPAALCVNATVTRTCCCHVTRHEDARKALEAARQKSFFGKKVQAEPHDGVNDNESTDVFRPPEADLDEYHHKATRTLFVGNLTKDSTKEELKSYFHNYGDILVRSQRHYQYL